MTELWPISFEEANLEETVNIRPQDIASYTYPPGCRERYTEDGWGKFMEILRSSPCAGSNTSSEHP